MSDPKKAAPDAAKSLPAKDPKGVEDVKGGVLRRGGADDDLEDLEVER